MLKEQYGLSFLKKYNNIHNFVNYACIPNLEIQGSSILAELLVSLSNVEPESLLEEVNHAIIGIDFEENYNLDQSSDVWVVFSPPNAVISNRYTIPLNDLKVLLEEWIVFVQN